MTIKLLGPDIDKLRYEMTYNDQKREGGTSFSQFIRRRRRVDLDNLPVGHSLYECVCVLCVCVCERERERKVGGGGGGVGRYTITM